VALDIDGTIMHEDETIDPSVREAVMAAYARGHTVTLATGRSWSTTYPVLTALDLNPDYVVCANGAVIMGKDDSAVGGYVATRVETFDPRAVLERIRTVLPGGRFMVELPDGFRLFTAGLTDWNLTNAREVSFNELLETVATRVVVTSPDHDIDDFLVLVDQMGLHHVSYSIGWTAWLDIAPDGINKATALERVRGWLGVRLDRVIAVGDGHNDVEMFGWAGASGRAVAMGQAADEVKDAATEIGGSIADAGLAAVLDSLP